MKKFLSTAFITISALVTGFAAMAVPFRLFDELSPAEMKALFIAEIVVYFAITSIFLLIKEQKKERKVKDEKMKSRHKERVLRRQQELKGIKVSNYDLAA